MLNYLKEKIVNGNKKTKNQLEMKMREEAEKVKKEELNTKPKTRRR